jgi:hypothetical protein
MVLNDILEKQNGGMLCQADYARMHATLSCRFISWF